MSIQIYIVMGSTGEYSNRTEWAVGAYQDKAMAEQHADLAKIEAHAIEKARGNRHDSICKGANVYDPKMEMYSTGTDYYVVDVDLLDAIPGIDG